ncbi:MAG: carbon-nitrogen hydrolase family protein [Providencia sp.]|uniref:carbon-nitrogen hydrolase family protein n=1 Tax=Providencia sp. TaxID=589 RepID=UPI003F954762
MKIAIAQLASSPNKQQNLNKACEAIQKAAQGGADMVLLPEMFMAFVPPDTGISYADIAEPINGPFVSQLAKTAKENGIYVTCGIYESALNEPKRAFNTTIMLNRQGELVYHYQKTHLYDAFSYQESLNIIQSNNKLEPIETEFGKIGILVCYELRFPEVARKLALAGADLLLVPTAWVSGPLKEEHYQGLVKIRALENTIPVCACDQTGNIFIGRSLICDAMGVTIASAGYDETVFFAEISTQHTAETRQKLPCIQNRRPELY